MTMPEVNQELLQLWKEQVKDDDACACFTQWLEIAGRIPYVDETMNMENLSPERRYAEHRELVKAVIKDSKEGKDPSVLVKRFTKRMEFGTAGLRGPMGIGFTTMNVITILQTTQGVCSYLMNHYSQEDRSNRGVVIGFDGRYNSRRFAHITAAVFASKNFKVYLMDSTVVATPLLAYGVIKMQCLAGVMITASHNPKADNGYKLYAADGVQIVQPANEQITQQILENLDVWDGVSDMLSHETGLLRTSVKKTDCTAAGEELVSDPVDDLWSSYVKDVCADLRPKIEQTRLTSLRVVYTAMHGVGMKYVERLVEAFGFDRTRLITVKEQAQPDPSFPTVGFPNPEEKGALDLAMDLATKESCPVIIANDPDADRFACAEKQGDKWHIFTGDEIGILFASYLLRRHPYYGTPKQRSLLFTTTAVSSKMLQKLAEVEGVQYEETLTGFKWIMNKAVQRAQCPVAGQEEAVPVFSYEEALGYACGMTVRDKDGVSASGVWLEMACQLYHEGRTISDELRTLREKYGYFVNSNSYYLCYDPLAVRTLFDEFRNNGLYLWKLGKFAIARIRDVTTGFDSAQEDKKSALPLTPDSQMVTLFMENGCVVTLRASGTEPKLKYYAEGSGKDPVEVMKKLTLVVDELINNLLQPCKYELSPPKTG
eukprot:GHVQ01022857.1.p1 GENE.GHVQ01022857.1~~GHVQ01022857.1.p1  ORF type:complete len:656 (-),score=100.26 GHVQ01022857.1:545-2512(-)